MMSLFTLLPSFSRHLTAGRPHREYFNSQCTWCMLTSKHRTRRTWKIFSIHWHQYIDGVAISVPVRHRQCLPLMSDIGLWYQGSYWLGTPKFEDVLQTFWGLSQDFWGHAILLQAFSPTSRQNGHLQTPFSDRSEAKTFSSLMVVVAQPIPRY